MNNFDGGNDMDEAKDALTKSSGMFGPASNSLLSGPRVSINLKTAVIRQLVFTIWRTQEPAVSGMFC
jgi:hypothetical protein